MKTCLVVGSSARAQEAARKLEGAGPWSSFEDAELVIAVGGDGFMLETMRRCLGSTRRLYGMNAGRTGFLLNPFEHGHLFERIERALVTEMHPLEMEATTSNGQVVGALAINEVAVLRSGPQTAHLKVLVNSVTRLRQLEGDGLMVATPAGSSAYNASAGGPVLPIDSNVLALTPVCASQPRRWPGALLRASSEIEVSVLDPAKRPVRVSADNHQVPDVTRVVIRQDPRKLDVLFDADHDMDERILRRQFWA